MIKFLVQQNVDNYQWCSDFYLNRFSPQTSVPYFEKSISTHSRSTFKQKVFTRGVSFWWNKNVNTYQWCCDYRRNNFFLLTFVLKHGWQIRFWKIYAHSIEVDIQAESFYTMCKFSVEQKCWYIPMVLWLLSKQLFPADIFVTLTCWQICFWEKY